MSIPSPDDLPVWATLLSLAAHFAAGIGLGILYFRALWWNARLFAGGGRAALSAGLMICRIAVLVGALALASREGALPLLVSALGIFVARFAVMRQLGKIMP